MEKERVFSKGGFMRKLFSIFIVFAILLCSLPAVAQWSFNPVSPITPPTSVWNPGIKMPTSQSVAAESQWNGNLGNVPNQRIDHREQDRINVGRGMRGHRTEQPINRRISPY